MGNAVSAAEMAASQIVHPVFHDGKTELAKGHPHVDYHPGDIPPECPMHKKLPQKSECPINHEEVSPLNMVMTIVVYF